MTIPTSSIRKVEIELITQGYTQRLWRRGVMGTRVFAKGNERIVLVRNTGQDRHPVENEPPTVENWFARLEAVLDELVKGPKLTDLLLFGDGAISVPEPFLAWCQAQGARIHISEASFFDRKAR